jgi:hypothetical protein
MKKFLLSLGVAVTIAMGGEYAEELTRCLINHTT